MVKLYLDIKINNIHIYSNINSLKNLWTRSQTIDIVLNNTTWCDAQLCTSRPRQSHSLIELDLEFCISNIRAKEPINLSFYMIVWGRWRSSINSNQSEVVQTGSSINSNQSEVVQTGSSINSNQSEVVQTGRHCRVEGQWWLEEDEPNNFRRKWNKDLDITSKCKIRLRGLGSMNELVTSRVTSALVWEGPFVSNFHGYEDGDPWLHQIFC